MQEKTGLEAKLIHEIKQLYHDCPNLHKKMTKQENLANERNYTYLDASE